MLITLREAEYFEISVDNANLHDCIAINVLQTIREELLGIIGWMTNRLIVKFKKHITVIQTIMRVLRRIKKEYLVWRHDG